MMEPVDVTPIYERYKDQLVAVADDRVTVLGFGKRPVDALKMAAKKGEADPVLKKVPPKVRPMIGYGIQAPL